MKSILAVADGGPVLDTTLAVANAWAGAFGATLDVLHVQDDRPMAATALVGAAEVAAIGAVVDMAQKEASTRTEAAKAAYKRVTPNANWIGVEGDEPALVAAYGRLADLLVLERPGSDPRRPDPVYVAASIFETGRAVLIVPPGGAAALPKRAVLAWNDSVQSARALAAALPVLARCSSVVVLSVGKDKERAPTAGVVAYLKRNGIAAEGKGFDPGSVSARARGRAVLGQAEAFGADLLVMGAFGQGRLMNFLGLGGATGKIITAAKMPVLLAH